MKVKPWPQIMSQTQKRLPHPLQNNDIFPRKIKGISSSLTWVINQGSFWAFEPPKPSIHTGQGTRITTSSSRWFVTWRTQTRLFPRAARQTSSCFASLCIPEMKRHIFSQHTGMARPHYSTHSGIHSSRRCTVAGNRMEEAWFLLHPWRLTTVQGITICQSDMSKGIQGWLWKQETFVLFSCIQ